MEVLMSDKFHAPIEPLVIGEDILKTLIERQTEDTTWFAYQNIALDSSDLGRLQFIQVGPNRTYKEPPEQAPDTMAGLGWRYRCIGAVDTSKKEIGGVAFGIMPLHPPVAAEQRPVRRRR